MNQTREGWEDETSGLDEWEVLTAYENPTKSKEIG